MNSDVQESCFQDSLLHSMMESCLKDRLLQGMTKLWSGGLLFDYTITTSDGKIFKAHRAVLASISDYFQVMLCGQMLESSKDSVELKGIDSCGFGPLLEFIYTGKLMLTEEIVSDVLAAATHLQIDPAVVLCTEFLESSLRVDNCADIIQISEIYDFKVLKRKVDQFVFANFSDIVKNGHHCALSASQLSRYLRSDGLNCGTEFGLFTCIRQWLDYDKDTRLKEAATMMQFVRFPLMLPSDITEISKSSPELVSPGSPGKKFLDQAVKYHNMALNKRATVKSTRTTVRNSPCIVSFSGSFDDQTTSKGFFAYDLHEAVWHKLPDLNQGFSDSSVTVLQNYMYVCGGVIDDGQTKKPTKKCYLFDPRFMQWSSIADMNENRSNFSLVTCQGAIYAISGCTEFSTATNTPTTNTDKIEKYSVQNDEWEVIGELPVAVRNHTSCVLNGKIYISGGQVDDFICSKKFYCFDPGNMQLNALAAMPHSQFNHYMITTTTAKPSYMLDSVSDEEDEVQDVVCTINTAEMGKNHYYDESRNQWMKLKTEVPPIWSQWSQIAGSLHNQTFFINGMSGDFVGNLDPEDGECKAITMGTLYDFKYLNVNTMKRYPEKVWFPLCCILTLPQQVMNDAPFVEREDAWFLQ